MKIYICMYVYIYDAELIHVRLQHTRALENLWCRGLIRLSSYPSLCFFCSTWGGVVASERGYDPCGPPPPHTHKTPLKQNEPYVRAKSPLLPNSIERAQWLEIILWYHYMYVFMYIYIYMYTYKHACIYIYIYVYIYKWIHIVLSYLNFKKKKSYWHWEARCWQW